MKFWVQTIERKTRKCGGIEIEATDADAAVREAGKRGLAVTAVDVIPNPLPPVSLKQVLPRATPGTPGAKLPPREGKTLTASERWSMRLLGALAGGMIVIGLLGIFTPAPLSNPSRFASDNAWGAAANAAERLKVMVEETQGLLTIICGLLLAVLVSLGKLRATIRGTGEREQLVENFKAGIDERR